MSAAVVCIILLISAKVDCSRKTATPSIHSSRVVSAAAEGRTSSCAVVEQGVPACQDPADDDIAHGTLSALRTPYPDNGFYGARDNRKSTTSRPLGWWWRLVENLKRNTGKKRPVSSTAAAVRDDASPTPETIVTYSIKGCSPTKVPFDLSPCSDLSSPAGAHRVSTTRVIYYVPPPTSQIDTSGPFDFDLK